MVSRGSSSFALKQGLSCAADIGWMKPPPAGACPQKASPTTSQPGRIRSACRAPEERRRVKPSSEGRKTSATKNERTSSPPGNDGHSRNRPNTAVVAALLLQPLSSANSPGPQPRYSPPILKQRDGRHTGKPLALAAQPPHAANQRGNVSDSTWAGTLPGTAACHELTRCVRQANSTILLPDAPIHARRKNLISQVPLTGGKRGFFRGRVKILGMQPAAQSDVNPVRLVAAEGWPWRATGVNRGRGSSGHRLDRAPLKHVKAAVERRVAFRPGQKMARGGMVIRSLMGVPATMDLVNAQSAPLVAEEDDLARTVRKPGSHGRRAAEGLGMPDGPHLGVAASQFVGHFDRRVG